MWHLPKLDNRLVTIHFQPHVLSCSIITPSQNPAPYTLSAYQETSLTHFELEQLKLFNPTAIFQYIATFLRAHRAHNAYIACTLHGPGVFEQFMQTYTTQPTLDTFALPDKHKYFWDYRYAYPLDHGRWMFYVAGIKKELLLQYKLFAIRHKLNITTITTQRIALLSLYKFQNAATFRESKLAIDMLQHNNMPEELFSTDTLHRTLYIPPSLAGRYTHPSHLLYACGLHIAERIYREAN